MDFYCLARKDGVYDVICTRCFATVISTTDPSFIQEAQTVHRCTVFKSSSLGTVSLGNELGKQVRIGAPSMLARLRCVRLPVLLVLAILVLYAFPTGIELLLFYSTHRWVDVLFVGDLFGCGCIYFVLKKGHLAMAIYLSITAVEATVYGLRFLPVQSLCWFADTVPTMVFIALAQGLRKPQALLMRNHF